jgi:hypothetical protein
MRPELNAKKKIVALEHRKALLDALVAFIKAHPQISPVKSTCIRSTHELRSQPCKIKNVAQQSWNTP